MGGLGPAYLLQVLTASGLPLSLSVAACAGAIACQLLPACLSAAIQRGAYHRERAHAILYVPCICLN